MFISHCFSRLETRAISALRLHHRSFRRRRKLLTCQNALISYCRKSPNHIQSDLFKEKEERNRKKRKTSRKSKWQKQRETYRQPASQHARTSSDVSQLIRARSLACPWIFFLIILSSTYVNRLNLLFRWRRTRPVAQRKMQLTRISITCSNYWSLAIPP